MTEYITKGQAVDALKETLWDDDFDEFLIHYFELSIKKVKPADVAPVVHGHWRIIKEAPIARKFIPFNELTELDLQNECRCSRCGFNCSIGVGQSHLANYCPNCGARMDGGKRDA